MNLLLGSFDLHQGVLLLGYVELDLLLGLIDVFLEVIVLIFVLLKGLENSGTVGFDVDELITTDFNVFYVSLVFNLKLMEINKFEFITSIILVSDLSLCFNNLVL